MIETPADRLASLRALGAGAKLKAAAGCFDIIFDNEYVLAGDVEERGPVATMRSSDAADADLRKDVVVEVYNPFDDSRKSYRVKRLEPDGTGMTLVVLGA